ncbi:MAG TPA: hypothetical protein PKV49_02865, partial [bacterium]|nr:hypothetical protein [bacterium]
MGNCLARKYKTLITGSIILIVALLLIGHSVLAASVTTSSNESSGALKFTPQVGLPGFMSEYVFTENSTMPIAKLMGSLFKYGIQIIG